MESRRTYIHRIVHCHNHLSCVDDSTPSLWQQLVANMIAIIVPTVQLPKVEVHNMDDILEVVRRAQAQVAHSAC